MSAAISPDVLELLERIRTTQSLTGCTFDEALETARHDIGDLVDPEAIRSSLVHGAAWALYALELHDAAEGRK